MTHSNRENGMNEAENLGTLMACCGVAGTVSGAGSHGKIRYPEIMAEGGVVNSLKLEEGAAFDAIKQLHKEQVA